MEVDVTPESGSLKCRDAYGEDDIPDRFSKEYTALRNFEVDRRALTRSEMTVIVEQAIELLSRFYVHLPLKQTLYGIDPIGALTALATRVRAMPSSASDPHAIEARFHDEMTAIFTSLRDRHTIYHLPDPYRRRVACLPFLIERCSDDGAESGVSYIVSKISPTLTEFWRNRGTLPELAAIGEKGEGPLIRVTAFNGIPIARAVELNGEANAGGNREARLARGLERLTFRWLGIGPPPAENWITLSYTIGDDEREHCLRFPWLVIVRPQDDRAPSAELGRLQTAAASGRDEEGEWIRRVKQALLGGQDRPWDPEPQTHAFGRRMDSYGYLRIFSFDVDDSDGGVDRWVTGIRETLGADASSELEGLIIDLRGNPGGHIGAAERLLQELCAERVDPEGLQFRNTPEIGALAERFLRDQPGEDSTRPLRDDASDAGAPYIPSPPIHAGGDLSSAPPIYQGPVAVVVDPLTYSAAEIFTAGFQDNRRGPVVGTGRQTGGGGGNVWPYELMLEYASSRVLTPLPLGASFDVAIRRTTRVGERAGLGLEDLGVRSTDLPLTAVDVLGTNEKLIEAAIEVLREDPRGAARLRVDGDGPFEVTFRGIDRLDVYLDGRPFDSLVLQAGKNGEGTTEVVTRDGFAPPTSALFLGYKGEAGGAPRTALAAYRWTRAGRPEMRTAMAV